MGKGGRVDKMYYLGVDLGGMSIKAGIVDSKGEILAKNKVQTFAIFKISGTIFFVPIFGVFMTDNIRYLFGLIPNFWSFECIKILKETGGLDIIPLGIGFAFHIAILAALFYVFNKKF